MTANKDALVLPERTHEPPPFDAPSCHGSIERAVVDSLAVRLIRRRFSRLDSPREHRSTLKRGQPLLRIGTSLVDAPTRRCKHSTATSY